MRNFVIILILSCGLWTPAIGAKPLPNHMTTTTNTSVLLHRFAANNVLYLFYDSNCPICEDFAPVLKRITNQYKIKVVAISVDGGSLAEFPAKPMDEKLLPNIDIDGVPQVYALNIHTHKIKMVADGGMGATELRMALLQTAKNSK